MYIYIYTYTYIFVPSAHLGGPSRFHYASCTVSPSYKQFITGGGYYDYY